MTNKAPTTDGQQEHRAGTRISIWSLRHSLFLVLGICSLGSAALGADDWSLTTADFRTSQVSLQSVGADSITVSTEGQTPRTVPMNQFLRLHHSAEPATIRPARFVAILGANDVAMGQPRAIRGDNLIWDNPILGELAIPLKNVTGITQASLVDASSAPAAQTEDVVEMANGDTLRGIISDLDNTSVSIQPTGGTVTRVALDSVRRIQFASLGSTSSQAPQREYSIRLADRTLLAAKDVRVQGPTISITLRDGAKRDLPLSAVQLIEQTNGPVTWLSSLTPTESISKPFLELAWPARMNRAVDGEPIRDGETVYDRGIGVHSYSSLSWTIDPAAKAFRTRFAIAGDRPYANVTIRIKLDDRILHEKVDVRSGPISDPIVIPIQGQKKLTLEVDYGQNYDVQDRLNWIEPAFLNFTPEPSTP